MFTTIHFTLILYWTIWISMYPSVPYWNPHGAVMAPIVAAAISFLMGKYLVDLANRT